MSTPRGPGGVQGLGGEVGRLFGLYDEQVDRLRTERTQENERLRADSERLAALAIENTRLREETARLQAEREELLAAFSRMADLVEQVRRSRGGGGAGEAMGGYVELRGFVGGGSVIALATILHPDWPRPSRVRVRKWGNF